MASERIQRQIDRLLDEADQAFGEFDYDALQEIAEAILRADPENSDAIAYLDISKRDISTEDSPQSATAVPASSQTEATPASQPVSCSEPTSFSGGRYVVERFLGEGGKKLVYLVHDELLDRDVAFALIKTEGLDEVSRTRISNDLGMLPLMERVLSRREILKA